MNPYVSDLAGWGEPFIRFFPLLSGEEPPEELPVGDGDLSRWLKIAVTTTASASTQLPSKGNSLLIANEPGLFTVFFSVGDGVQVATVPATSNPVSTCTPTLSGMVQVFTIPNDTIKNISFITATGTGSVYVAVGENL